MGNTNRPMAHLNGNMLCAVDLETTGLEVGHHDIWQICILPLNWDYKPLKEKGLNPFYTNLKPHHPHHADPKAISRTKLTEACLTGIDAYRAADMLQEWFQEKLKLPLDKKICPLAHNWPYDAAFLRNWLGNTQFESIFHAWYRDLLPVSLYLNDSAELNIEQIPYPKSNLGFLCARFGVVNEVPHDALSDCVATAECYSKALKRLF